MQDDFPIHLSDAELSASDEYAAADPYSVEEGGSFHEQRTALTLELVDALAAENARILDLGCGQGHITHAIRTIRPKARLFGLDYSISAIRYAHAHFRGISFAVGDAIASPYPEGPFDLIVCNNLWEHVTDPMGLLARANNALRPGGIIIISTPSRYRVSNLLRAILGKPIAMMSRHHVTEYSVGQMKELLAWGGFTVERIAARPSGSPKSQIACRLANALARLVRSHHRFEPTIFYAAKKNDTEPCG